MKTRLPAETKAWACLTANALMAPGLGSMMAGQWATGLAQIVLSLAGFAMTIFWALHWLRRLLEEQAIPEGVGPYFKYGISGLLIFAGAWLWSVLGSLAQLRAAQRAVTPSAGRSGTDTSTASRR